MVNLQKHYWPNLEVLHPAAEKKSPHITLMIIHRAAITIPAQMPTQIMNSHRLVTQLSLLQISQKISTLLLTNTPKITTNGKKIFK